MPGRKETIIEISVLVCVVGLGLYLYNFQGPKYFPLQLLEGATGVLPCHIHVTPKEVAWMKVRKFWPDTTLVTYHVNTGKRSGSGYEEGQFNIRDDYCLEITKVKACHRGDYYCIMKSMADKIDSSDHIVTVDVFGIGSADADSSKDVLYSIISIVVITMALAGIRIPLMGGPKSKHSGRISYYELWKLANYTVELGEGDKLVDALKVLTKTSSPDLHINPKSIDDLYGLLHSWKEECNDHGRTMNQPEQLYEKCIAAGMEKIIQKLQDLRRIILEAEGPSSVDLEHLLWHISKQSPVNITRLLEELEVDDATSIVDSSSELTKIITKASEKLETWKKGNVSMNPNVLLCFALETLKLSDGENEFFQVPENEKLPLSQKEVEKYVHAVTIRHCLKIFGIITAHGGGKDVLINQKPNENEKVLFETCRMINEWLNGQKCSNYNKRQTLTSAVQAAKSSVPDDELFSIQHIKKRESGDRNKTVAVAYDLLMTDILPFTSALNMDKSKLQEYEIQTIDSSHLTMGTIGLVNQLLSLL